jgi:hypothetical protein
LTGSAYHVDAPSPEWGVTLQFADRPDVPAAGVLQVIVARFRRCLN